MVMSYSLDDFSFDLPESLIASRPLPERSESKLLHIDKQSGSLHDNVFSDVCTLLKPNDLLVFNNTQVMKARLHAYKLSGGHVEILIERILEDHFAKVMIKSNRPLKLPVMLTVDDHLLEVELKDGQFYQLRSRGPSFYELMVKFGEMPLPPYMGRKADASDLSRYQTVYAKEIGAVAAPTAGLHFDEPLLMRLNNLGVDQAFLTLHVGAGTFLPVKAGNIGSHVMHSERFEITRSVWDKINIAKQRGGRVVAVGTTSMRALESACLVNAQNQDYNGDTELFIRPPFDFQVCDGLITNFHLPKSTLMMLVSAFAGYDNVMNAYEHAIATGYRFYSYGDSSIII